MVVITVSEPEGVMTDGNGIVFSRTRIARKLAPLRLPPLVNFSFTSSIPPGSTVVFMDCMLREGLLLELFLLQETTTKTKRAGIRNEAGFMMLF